MTTARDIINAAYRKINVLGQGSRLSASEIADGLEALNDMIESWSTQGALIYTETKETFNLSGATSYTIGSAQTFNTTVPKDIKSAYVTYAGQDTPVEIIDAEEYGAIYDKDLSGCQVQKLYFDSQYPTANIYVYPVTGTSLTLFSEKPLTTFTSVNSDFAMPPEYKRALIYNLAVELAPEYEKEASLTVKRIAKQSLDWIKAQNRKNNKGSVKVDSAYLGRGTYNIYSGQYS